MNERSYSVEFNDVARSSPSFGQLVAVTVTFNPDNSILARQLDLIPSNVLKVVVDNASRQDLRAGLRELLDGRVGAFLIENDVNVGLAAALNQGARAAKQLHPEVRYLLLLDQDTEPSPVGVESLLESYQRLRAAGVSVGCVGPTLIDVGTGLEHGFHQKTAWRWVRRYRASSESAPVSVANLNGSGTLVSVALFEALGGLDEDLFIDHVDTDWSFRVLNAGLGLFALPDVVFLHRMGERSLRFWAGGWRVWPYRSPRRHYFLFRNSMRLLRRPYVPVVWKAWALAKLALTFVVHGLFDRDRGAQLLQMIAGLRQGIDEVRKRL